MSKINVSLLKDYRLDFNKEKNRFNSTSFSSFSSSYIKRCSDSYVIRMRDKLQGLYEKVQKGYNNIDAWWIDYNSDVENLEKALSDEGSSGSIKVVSVRNCVSSNFSKLPDYTIPFVDVINLNFEPVVPDMTFVNSWVDSISSSISSSTSASVETFGGNSSASNNWWGKVTSWWDETTDDIGHWFKDVGSDVSDGAKTVWSDVSDWWNFDALPWITNAAERVNKVKMSVNATVAVGGVSLVEGVLQFGEAMVDFVDIAGTALKSVGTGIIDGGQALYGLITGNEWTSLTKKMWEETMACVSEEYVSGWFDSFYQNTGVGQWLADSSYGFDNVRGVVSGIGYIAGVVALTIATFGAGGAVAAGGAATATATTAAAASLTTEMSVIAGMAGIGKGTQNAWADGADLLEGLASGTLTGIWEGIQFYIGGKIGSSNIFGKEGLLKLGGSSGVGTKFLNSLARVVLDGLDGGIEGFVQPLLNAIYQDGYYDEENNYHEFTSEDNAWERYKELFNDAGGWANVGIQTAIGSGSSVLGEIFDLGKYFGKKDVSNQMTETIAKEIDTKNIGDKINRYNELYDIMHSEDYLKHEAMINAYGDKLSYGNVKAEIEAIRTEYDILKSELMDAKAAGKVDGVWDDTEWRYVFEEKPLNNIKIKSVLEPSNNLNINLEKQIGEANLLFAKDSTSFYHLNVDDIDELPIDFYSRFSNPERLVLNVDGNTYTYSQFLELDENDITALFAKATHSDVVGNNWSKEKLSSHLHNLFDASYGYDVIQRDVLDKIEIVDASNWKEFLRQRGQRENVVGFVDGNSVMYLPSNANMHTAVHESFHKVSELGGGKVFDASGNIRKVTGIREFYTDGFNTTWSNETLTEYLSSKYSDGKIYGSMYGESNVLLWNRIDEAIGKVDNRDLLSLSYFNNDTSYIRQFFDKYSNSSYDDFARKLQFWYSSTKDLNSIVTSIEKNVYKENHPILYIIKSIFGGNWT